MLSQKDLDEIQKLIKINTRHLPTREEFYNKMDELMKELKDLREEVTVVTGYKDQIENHETRIIKLEEVLEPQN